MATALLSHPDCLDHVTPPGHPEQLARLDAVIGALADLDLVRISAPLAADDDILRLHPRSHLEALRRRTPPSGWASLDPDTHLSPGSLGAIWRAAGAAIRAVDLVMEGRVRNAFCATRPPGHHAERDTAMGFCFLGNAALAAKHALDFHGLSRVAIVDFDVHHGNGTQDLVEDDPRILFISTHQMPLYPGTGDAGDRGPHDTVRNIPLGAGTKGARFREIVTAQVLPEVARFAPEFLIISAGFDAHVDDPLAGLALLPEDFGWITRALCDLADSQCGGRVVSCLEGGYDLQALADCAAAHLKELMRDGGTGG